MQKKYKITINGREYEVVVEELEGLVGANYSQNFAPLSQVSPAQVPMQQAVPAPMPAPQAPAQSKPAPAPKPSPAPSAGGTVVSAPMPGKILKVLVQPGAQVKNGQNIMVLEAMKMENEILAPSDGVVREVKVKEGDNVNTGDTLAVIG
ncbi:acetyl-CoA carboxylase biotin carboxyl carrier protein subunit [Acetomicrobium sp.]|uniref:biotin/lipoyl-containing protein n=1 Tax=Acetomicrobium sp. TaxID=1872099 RepID=UPI001BCA6E6C|nr:acetyl-CoA carboxylase biotin carboxyl carrier protein subunit [Acetomicrobium sp.]